MATELRADARRNRELILDAAQALFLAQGPTAPLDQIAERAGVGNATLYRRFPTREDLIKQVVLENMGRVAAQAREARAEEPDAWSAFVRLCERVVAGRMVALLPILGPYVPQDKEFYTARDEVLAELRALLTEAREHGLRSDVDAGDLVLILATVTRPLPAVVETLTAAIQPRHLALLLDGLRTPAPTALPGRAVSGGDITSQLAR